MLPRWLIAILFAGLGMVACPVLAGGPQMRLEMADGSAAAGELESIAADEVRIVADGVGQSFPVAAIRRIVRTQSPAALPQPPVTVTTTAGEQLTGDDFAWTGDVAAVLRGAERLELPIGLVQVVAWRRPEDGADAPAWLKTLPEQPESDLVIVGSGAAAECVSCAITGVTAENVTVVLDGETIPVKRAKVAGLRWLRPDGAARGGITVATRAGRIAAAEIVWSADGGLLLDGRVRAPADWLDSIDYAAGRTVWLTAIEAERIDVEPYFGGLKNVAGLAAFFAPRSVAAADNDAAPSLILRPRTVGVWRVPTDSRRFRGVLRSAGEATPRAVVVIDLDGRELFRHAFERRPETDGDAKRPSAGDTSGVPIDLDVSGCRRLTLTVDFAAGGPGGPVAVDGARFEK